MNKFELGDKVRQLAALGREGTIIDIYNDGHYLVEIYNDLDDIVEINQPENRLVKDD